MTKKRKLLILSLFTCLSVTTIFGMESKAEGVSGEQTSSSESGLMDENSQRPAEVTAMDENGNITVLDDMGEKLVTPGASSRARSALNVQVVNFRTKNGEVTNYVEEATGISGYTYGATGADAAYLGTSGGKVRFMLSGVVGLVDASEVQIVNFTDAKVVSCYQVVNGRLRHNVAQDMTTSGYATQLDNGPAPSYLNGDTTYYSYDGHYFYIDYATMLMDYQNNTRSHSVNSENPYYNYFQYLSLRSQSGYSDGELTAILNGKVNASSKMRNTGGQFVDRQNTYGVNALAMAAIGANESGWGTSRICREKNNLFGLDAVDTSPGASADTFASVDDCIRQFADSWLSQGYLTPSDWRYKGGFLGNKASGINVSYASDPYWGEKAAALMWELDGNGGSKDYGTYTIGIKDTVSTSHSNYNVRNANNTSAASLYKTGTHSSYAVLILDANASNSFYKIQSDPVLTGDRSAIASGTGAYNFAEMYGYISSDSITVVHNGSAVAVPNVLDSIYISAAPSKTAYTEGESFDAAGMAVKAKWSDGSETDVTGSVTYPADALVKGMTEITLQYVSEGITKSAVQAITVKEKVSVTEVTVNPAAVEMKAGSSRTFGIRVSGTGNPAQSVTWSVDGAKSGDTNIDINGKLQLGADETAEALTVTAVSTMDPSKSGTANVTVTKEPAEEPSDPGGNSNMTEVRDEANGIKISGLLPEDASLNVTVIDAGNDRYTNLTEPVKTNTILGVYDISLTKELNDNQTVQLSYTVDSKYNGQKVLVLHYTEQDGKTFLENLSGTVENGVVTVQVSEFSPFVFALDDAGANEDMPGDNNSGTDGDGGDTAGDTGDSMIPGVTEEGTGSDAGGDKGTLSTLDGTDPQNDIPQKEKLAVDQKLAAGSGTDVKPVVINKAKAPKTGDSSNSIVWGILMIGSLICVAAVFVRNKYIKKDSKK